MRRQYYIDVLARYHAYVDMLPAMDEITFTIWAQAFLARSCIAVDEL